jgi:glycine/D-amino acid oxidase-like deaminating enzyme
MRRRQFIQHLGLPFAAAAASTASLIDPVKAAEPGSQSNATAPASVIAVAQNSIKLAPVRAEPNRITGVYPCTRPFRRAGPRIELEKVGRKHVVHNYGHGGTGWSMSWGSGTLALRLVQSTGAKKIGIIGCGAIGLTTAVLAQRAGLSVRIYAKALPPHVASMNATGVWSPDSRFCEQDHGQEQMERWAEMARISYATYQSMIGLPGKPIEWFDNYALHDVPFGSPRHMVDDEPEYADFSDAAPELRLPREELTPGTHPFKKPYVRRIGSMMFNISTYSRMLMDEFLAMGGKFEIVEFSHPRELQKLPESTLVNATGYGARALFGDESVIPVRGQTVRLIPQPEVNYGISTGDLNMVPRSDGLLVQIVSGTGNFNNSDAAPDRPMAEEAVRQLAELLRSS